MKDDEEKWLFRVGIDSVEEIRRGIGWDVPRCICGAPLPDVGNFCGDPRCRNALVSLRQQATDIDQDSSDEGER